MFEQEKHSIVEIGPGIMPVYELFDKVAFQKACQGAHYVAIDCSQKELNRFIKESQSKENAVLGDLSHLPLQENSAHQIWLVNVFGGFEFVPEKREDGTVGFKLSWYDAFKELARVIRKSGKIYICEFWFPIREVEWLADEDFSAFGLEKKLYRGLPEIKIFLENMGDEMNLSKYLEKQKGYTPFVLELIKK